MSVLSEGRTSGDGIPTHPEERAGWMEKKVVNGVELFNGDRPIGEADSATIISGILMPMFEGSVTAYNLPLMRLGRTVLFEHMQGRPLSGLLNGCCVKVLGDDEHRFSSPPLLYVHGRSEALRGNVTVSAVVLADFPDNLSYRELMPQLPEIYKILSTCL